MRRAIAIFILTCMTLPASAIPVLSGFEANLLVEQTDAGRKTVVSLVSGGILGNGGIAHGLFDLNVGDNTPAEDTRWLVQNLRGTVAPDGQRILSFSFDDTGNFLGIEPTPFFDPNVTSGIEPTPFRIFLADYPPDPVRPAFILGELDFRNISGVTRGSLNGISGLQLINRSDGGADLSFAPFNIVSVPEPGTLALILCGVTGFLISVRGRKTTQ